MPFPHIFWYSICSSQHTFFFFREREFGKFVRSNLHSYRFQSTKLILNEIKNKIVVNQFQRVQSVQMWKNYIFLRHGYEIRLFPSMDDRVKYIYENENQNSVLFSVVNVTNLSFWYLSCWETFQKWVFPFEWRFFLNSRWQLHGCS